MSGNKRKYKSFLILLVVILVFGMGSASNANETLEYDITLRVEGISENIFYDTVSIEFSGELTVADFLTYVDENYSEINISGMDIGFITEINDEASSHFGGWDGWYYLVNSVSPSVGIADYVLSDNDRVVLYYGDMITQRPIIDLTDIENGKIKFTSVDITYDADFNEILNINPVVGASVTISELQKTYITNNDGEIDLGEIDKGTYSISISKYGDELVDGKYLPLVLRFSPDFTIEITDDVVFSEDLTEPGDSGVINFLLIALVAGLFGLISIKSNKVYSK